MLLMMVAMLVCVILLFQLFVVLKISPLLHLNHFIKYLKMQDLILDPDRFQHFVMMIFFVS